MNHALYFTGYTERSADQHSFAGLDPHTCYPSLQPSDDSNGADIDFPPLSYINQLHVDRFEEIDVRALDPSLALGFYFRTRQEFEEFCSVTQSECEWKRSQGITPLYSIEHSPPAEYTAFQNKYMSGDGGDGTLAEDEDEMYGDDKATNNGNDNDDDDEYVFI